MGSLLAMVLNQWLHKKYGTYSVSTMELILLWNLFMWPLLRVTSQENINIYLDADDVDKLFFESSGPLEGVLFGIMDLPGDEDFLATGGGVFLLLGMGIGN